MKQLQRARELDPLSIIVHAYAGQVYLFARQYEKSAEHLELGRQLNPNHALIRHNLGELHLARGALDDAVKELEKSVELSKRRNTHYLAMLACAYARAQRTVEARQILNELGGQSAKGLVSTVDLAALHTALGDRERALVTLERAYDARDIWLAKLKGWPWFDDLAGYPRFQALRQRMNFPD